MPKKEEMDLRRKMQEYQEKEELSPEEKDDLWEVARRIQRLDNANNKTLKTQLEKHGQWIKDVSTDK